MLRLPKISGQSIVEKSIDFLNGENEEVLNHERKLGLQRHCCFIDLGYFNLLHRQS